MTPSLREAIRQAFEEVNEGQKLLAVLAGENTEVARWVATIFIARRDGTNWDDATQEELRDNLQEELARELRGDYDF